MLGFFLYFRISHFLILFFLFDVIDIIMHPELPLSLPLDKQATSEVGGKRILNLIALSGSVVLDLKIYVLLLCYYKDLI